MTVAVAATAQRVFCARTQSLGQTVSCLPGLFIFLVVAQLASILSLYGVYSDVRGRSQQGGAQPTGLLWAALRGNLCSRAFVARVRTMLKTAAGSWGDGSVLKHSLPGLMT